MKILESPLVITMLLFREVYRYTNYRYNQYTSNELAGKLKSSQNEHHGTTSLKPLGGKLAPKLVYTVLRKELLKV